MMLAYGKSKDNLLFILKYIYKYLIFKLNLRYLQEFTPLGSGGGMYHFRDQIRAGNPSAFFVLNGDVCSDFPLTELYEFHKSKSPKAMVRWHSQNKKFV